MKVAQKDSAESALLMKDSKHAASATSCSFSAYLDREFAPSAELIAHRVGELVLTADLRAWVRINMTDLLWYCPKCGGSNERMETVPRRRKLWFFGKRKTKLIAICLDCWAEMEFVGTV